MVRGVVDMLASFSLLCAFIACGECMEALCCCSWTRGLRCPSAFVFIVLCCGLGGRLGRVKQRTLDAVAQYFAAVHALGMTQASVVPMGATCSWSVRSSVDAFSPFFP